MSLYGYQIKSDLKFVFRLYSRLVLLFITILFVSFYAPPRGFTDEGHKGKVIAKEETSNFMGPHRSQKEVTSEIKRLIQQKPVLHKHTETHLPQKQRDTLPEALTVVNRRFLESLRTPIAQERSTLGPAIFFENNVVNLINKGQIVASATAAPTIFYHQIKAYSHMCMTVMVKLWRLREAEQQRQWALKYMTEVNAAQQTVNTLGLTRSIAARQITLSALTYVILEEASERLITPDRLSVYIRSVKPLILKNFDDAARDHIDQLDRALGEIRQELNEEEWRQIQAFTYGPRGPRGGNLITQYLAYLVGQEKLIEGERVVYAEGVSTAETTFNLMAKFNIEQALGVMFFEDPMGLQRDVLANSARKILSARPRKPLTTSPSKRLLKRLDTDLILK